MMNFTSLEQLAVSRPPPPLLHHTVSHHSYDYDSAFYFDIWTLLASVGLLVVVVLINAVVFLSWRRQFQRGGYAAAANIHDNHFYFPNSSGNISFIDVGMVEETTADTKALLTMPPVIVNGAVAAVVNEKGKAIRKAHVIPVRKTKERAPTESTCNHQLDNDPDVGDRKGLLQ